MTQSSPPRANMLPSGWNATLRTLAEKSWSVSRQAPVLISQTRAVRSSLVLTRRHPSGLQASDLTQSVWPHSTFRQAPVTASQMRSVWSSLALISRRPSGLNARERISLICPLQENSGVALSLSQTRTSLDAVPAANRSPSGLIATLKGLEKVSRNTDVARSAVLKLLSRNATSGTYACATVRRDASSARRSTLICTNRLIILPAT